MAEMFLTVEQAAERMQLHPDTIRRQIRAGQLRSVRRGRVHRIPESALTEAPPRPRPQSAQVEELWRRMTTGSAGEHNAAIIALAQAPDVVRAEIERRSGEAAAKYYATPEGQAELADWRALDGEPFHDDEGDGDDL